jgi:hypothetical protein
MRTKRAIENQLRHFQYGCPKAGTEENEVWIQALEWVLAGDDPVVHGSSPVAKLVTAAIAATHALRSYEHGNSAPDLARGNADHLERAITEVLDARERDIGQLLAEAQKMTEVLAELQSTLESKKPAAEES